MSGAAGHEESRRGDGPDRRVGRGVLVVLLFAVLTIAFAAPLPFHVSSRLFSTGTDPDLWMWTLAWDAHAFLHQPWAIFDANIFYPAHYALAYSENVIGSALFAAPVLWTTGNPVLALNLVSLLSAVLCASGAYLLGRRVGLEPAGAVLTGLIFGFAPARFLRIEQLHLTTIQWVPFGLACLHTYLDRGGRANLRAFLAFFVLQALTSGHGAVFLSVASAGLVVYRLALGEPVAWRQRLADVGVPGAILLLPALLLALAYQGAHAEVPTLHRALDDYGLSLSSYFASPSHVDAFLFSYLPVSLTREPPDAYLFPGYLPLVLAAVPFLFFRRSPRIAREDRGSRERGRDTVMFYAGLTLVCFWLTLGPPLGLWRWVYWLPLFDFLRVPSRFVMLMMLGLAVLGGFGFERLTARAGARRRMAAATVLGGLLLAEFAAMPLDTRPERVEIPAIDRWLDTQPKPFVVAEVPVTDSQSDVTNGRRNTLYMLHSMAHWQKTVHGYSGVEPASFHALYWQLTTFPDPASLRTLTGLGVTYIVVHRDLYPPTELADADARFERYKDWLTLVHVEGDGRVYRLHRPAVARATSQATDAGNGDAIIPLRRAGPRPPEVSVRGATEIADGARSGFTPGVAARGSRRRRARGDPQLSDDPRILRPGPAGYG